jgi:hypothetical protein
MCERLEREKRERREKEERKKRERREKEERKKREREKAKIESDACVACETGKSQRSSPHLCR